MFLFSSEVFLPESLYSKNGISFEVDQTLPSTDTHCWKHRQGACGWMKRAVLSGKERLSLICPGLRLTWAAWIYHISGDMRGHWSEGPVDVTFFCSRRFLVFCYFLYRELCHLQTGTSFVPASLPFLPCPHCITLARISRTILSRNGGSRCFYLVPDHWEKTFVPLPLVERLGFCCRFTRILFCFALYKFKGFSSISSLPTIFFIMHRCQNCQIPVQHQVIWFCGFPSWIY